MSGGLRKVISMERPLIRSLCLDTPTLAVGGGGGGGGGWREVKKKWKRWKRVEGVEGGGKGEGVNEVYGCSEWRVIDSNKSGIFFIVFIEANPDKRWKWHKT